MPYVDRPGCRLSYTLVDVTPPWVEDPPTILFHHGVSTTSALWSGWIPALCEDYRLLFFDTRGFGQSSLNAEDVPWTWDLLVGDLLAVADACGLGRFHLVGESAGGTAAIATAVRHPDRLLSLTVSNGAHNGTLIRNVGRVWSERMATSGQEDWAAQMMEWRFFPGSLSAEKERWFRHQQATCSADATLAIADLLLRTDLSDEVAAIAVPTLILSPDASPFISAQIAADLHARIEGAELKVVPHSRHGLPFSHGPECAGSLKEFLQRRCDGNRT
jgi:pimeloyl-ACP methyl ester carboxylesterase